MIQYFSFDAMGTGCALFLYAPSQSVASSVAGLIFQEVDRIEERYSRYLPNSLLSKINRVASIAGVIDVDPETAALLDYVFMAHRISDGAFDITSGVLRRIWKFDSGRKPTVDQISECLKLVGLEHLIWENPILRFQKSGMEIDFGGIGKEYAVDRAFAICQEHQIHHGLIDFGGDIRVIGPHPDGKPWEISIRDPRNPNLSAQNLFLGAGSLATSGDYERYMEIDGQRYCHILNPQTGMPVIGLRSVSIQAEHCLFAGTIASIAMLKGSEAISWLNAQGVAYFCVDQEGHEHSMPLAQWTQK